MGFQGFSDTHRISTTLVARFLLMSAAALLIWRLILSQADPFLWAAVVVVGLAIGLCELVGEARSRMAWRIVATEVDRLTQNDRVEAASNRRSLASVSSAELGAAFERLAGHLAESISRRDVAESARVRCEIKARALAARYCQLEEVVDGLPEPVLAVDQDGELVLANSQARDLLSLDEGDGAPRRFEKILAGSGLVEVIADLRRRKGPAQRTVEVNFSQGPQAGRVFSAHCRTLSAAGDDRADDGQRVAVVLSNITHQQGARQRNAEFVAAVSHEMKTPLAGIKAYVELLADGDAEDRQTQEEFLSVISTQADRLQRLVENLLNLARIEAGVVHVQKQPLSLNELLEEAAAVVHPSAEMKRQRLNVELSSLYIGVLADRDMLLQAAINLLSNAVKYTPVGGQVWLRSRVTDQEICFEVEDTGVGLGEEDRERVFEKFYRVTNSKDMAPGTGLGLPLARHIVEDVHEGRLTVESALGVGSTFRVTLPHSGKERPRGAVEAIS